MQFPHALSLSFLLAFLGACGGGSEPATPPPAAWSEPTPIVTLDVPGPGYVFVEAVQPDAAGGLTVKWTQPVPSRTLPGFVHRQPSGSWTQVPSISADAGSIHQAWTMGASGVDSVLIGQTGLAWNTTLTAIRFADGAWSTPAPVASSVPVGGSIPEKAIYDAQRRLAFSPLGTPLLPAITRYDPAAGGWQPVEQLSPLPGTTQIFIGTGAIAADGRMMATWGMLVNGQVKHVYHTFRPGTGWSEPAVLPGIDEYGTSYKILAGAGGNFLMAHTSLNTHPNKMMLSRFNMAAGWESPVVVASALALTERGQLLPWDVHQGEGGHILATWTQSRELVPGGSVVWEPWSRFYDPATGWAPPVRAPEVIGGSAVRVGPSGKVVVASQSGISTLDGNGSWVTVDPPPPRRNAGNNGNTSFAIEPSGAITAVWRESDNNRITFMSSTYR